MNEDQILTPQTDAAAKQFLKDIAGKTYERSVKRLIHIARLIHKHPPESFGFPVYLVGNEEQKRLALDLTQPLTYTSIPLSPVEAGTFEEYGYDHWKSYAWPVVFGAGERDVIPGTNYFFSVVKDLSDSQKPKLKITWVIYSTLTVLDPDTGESLTQPDDQVRLPYLQDPWRSELINNGKAHPSLTYTFEVEIKDLI